MLSLILRLTPLALGVAASPLPIVAVLIMLISNRARPGSITLALCWVMGNAVAIGLAVYFSALIPAPRQGLDLGSEGVFTLLLGAGLVVMGGLARRGRRRSSEPKETPAWVSSVDNLSPVGAGFVAFTNATTSPKNLALAISAGRLLTSADVPSQGVFFGMAWYVLVASLSIVVPVVLYFVGGEQSVVILRRWREVVTANAAAVMEITLFVLGIGMSIKGLYNLFG